MCIHTYTYISPPWVSPHPSPPLQATTEHWADLSVLYGSFLLAIFTHGSSSHSLSHYSVSFSSRHLLLLFNLMWGHHWCFNMVAIKTCLSELLMWVAYFLTALALGTLHPLTLPALFSSTDKEWQEDEHQPVPMRSGTPVGHLGLRLSSDRPEAVSDLHCTLICLSSFSPSLVSDLQPSEGFLPFSGSFPGSFTGIGLSKSLAHLNASWQWLLGELGSTNLVPKRVWWTSGWPRFIL